MHATALEGFTLLPAGGLLTASAWYLAVLPASFTGLGLLACRIPRMGAVDAGLLPALGLAVYVLAGGLLNLLRLAFPLAVWVLLLAGLASFAQAVWRRRSEPMGVDPASLLLCVLALALATFTAATQAMPWAYNWNDDLQSYFAHPVRMLETGTIYGSPLSSVGAVSLGGIAFVQSAALVCLPLSAVNGSDAVLGLVLCFIPLVRYGALHTGVLPVVAVALVGLLAIDPFYVNISALYLGSTLMIAAVLLPVSSDNGEAFKSPGILPTGLLYAALVALKPTFLLFVILHVAFVFAAAAISGRGAKATLSWAVFTLLTGAALLSPWILVHLHHYLSASAAGPHRDLVHQAIDLAGSQPLANGFTGLGAYSLLVAVMAVIAAAVLALGPKPWKSAAVWAPLCAAFTGVAAYPALLFVFPRAVGYADSDPNAVRYYIPLAVGVFPALLCTASSAIVEGRSKLSARERLVLCVFLGLLALAGFGGSAAVRLRNAAKYHTLLPYPAAHDPVLSKAMERALGPEKEKQIRDLQGKIPEGASVVAWVYTPYLLDYSRNRIFDAELAGISNRWATMPAADYYLWEYRGSASLAARVQRIIDNLPAMDGFRIAPLQEFERRLLSEEASGNVVFRDSEFVLVRSAKERPAPAP